MDKLQELSRKFDQQASRVLGPLDNNVYVSSAVSLFVVLYACSVAPRLPPVIGRVLQNPLVKVLFFFVAAYSFQKNPSAAAVAAVGLVVLFTLLTNSNFRGISLPTFNVRVPTKTVRFSAVNDNSVIAAPQGSAGMVPTSELSLFDEESSCNSRNAFFPQYANMKTDSYEARDNVSNVSGFDPTAAYASI